MRSFLAIGFLVLISYSINAQTWNVISKLEARTILDQVADWYSEHQNFSVPVSHASFANYSTAIPHEHFDGNIVCKGIMYHSKELGMETIQNQDYNIVIDTESKLIVVSNPKDPLMSVVQNVDTLSLHSVTQCSLKKIGTKKTLRFDFHSGHKLEREEILIDDDDKVLEMTFYFSSDDGDRSNNSGIKEKPKVVVSYGAYDLSPHIDPAEFSEKPYVTFSEDKLTLTTQYSDYHLIDARLPKK